MIVGAIERKFDAIGFTSHAMFPYFESWSLGPKSAKDYVADIRAAAKKYEKYIKVYCGLETDYLPGVTTPEKSRYVEYGLDYIIGSLHWALADYTPTQLGMRNPFRSTVSPGAEPLCGESSSQLGMRNPFRSDLIGPDGLLSSAFVSVDHTPQILADGIRDSFNGSAKAMILAYHEQLREMVSRFDFDILGHPDLYRKYNQKHPFFDESEKWYRDELVKSADVIAASGKLVEVNTGAIGRNWRDDAYPSDEFRTLLRERGVKFVLNSDSHSVDSLDAGFDKYASAEDYVDFSKLIRR